MSLIFGRFCSVWPGKVRSRDLSGGSGLLPFEVSKGSRASNDVGVQSRRHPDYTENVFGPHAHWISRRVRWMPNLCQLYSVENRSTRSSYIVKSIVHASQVLNACQSKGEVLRLRDVVTRTGFNKGICFRLLYTLNTCGFIEKTGENQYRLPGSARRPGSRRRERSDRTGFC